MKKNGYIQGNGDYTLFVKRNGIQVIILLIYVDDMIAMLSRHRLGMHLGIRLSAGDPRLLN